MSLRPVVIGVLVGVTAGLMAFLSNVPSDNAALPEVERLAPRTEPWTAPSTEPSTESSASWRAAESASAQRSGPNDPLGAAASDGGESLARLRSIESSKARRDAALALVRALGNGRDAIARVAEALPPSDRENFVLDAIAQRSLDHADGALEHALELDGKSTQSEALVRIAKVLAERAPRMALMSGAAISRYELASAYKAAVFREWASADPTTFLAFIESAAASDLLVADDAVFQLAAASDPARLLASIDDIPLTVRSIAEQAALETMVRTDSSAAFGYVDALPTGSTRDRLLEATARSFAASDVDRALSWLDSRQPREAIATAAVFRVLAEGDPVRGVKRELFESMLDDPEQGRWARESLQFLEAATP